MNQSREKLLEFMDDNFDNIRKNKKICIVGCGGVGSHLALILTRSGFLNLKIIDFDIVDETNLSRQAFIIQDINKKKIIAIKQHIYNINKDVNLEVLNKKLDAKNSFKVLNNNDLIIDATDNFESRNIINNFCEKYNKDWLYNGAIKTQFVSCLFKGKDKKYNLVFSNSPKDEKASNVGILNSTPIFSASLAYNNIVKYFLKIDNDIMLKVDVFDNNFYKINL